MVIKEILTIEEASRIIDGHLESAEAKFLAKHGRYPSLLRVEDYKLLEEFLNISGEVEKHKAKGKKYKLVDNNLINSHDFEYRFLRSFLEREGFFSGENQQQIFDASMGRLIYDPPSREYRFRIETAKQLLEKNVEFPRDWDLFLDTIKTICEGETERAPDTSLCSLANNQGYYALGLLQNVGSWFALELRTGLRLAKKEKYESFGDLISTWEEYANPKLDFVKESYTAGYL